MKEPNPKFSESTMGDSESIPQKGNSKISSITNKLINGDLIDLFNEIPDAIEQSRLPFPVLVPIGERYACLEGQHLLSPGMQVQCIIIETTDISKKALALLKVSLWMTGILLGELRYVEQARNVRILYNLRIEDNGIITNRNGGDRRSESFKEQEGEHIRQYLARALDRSENTIRVYLDHTRYLTMEAMNDLARRGASKRFFIVACKLRTELITRLPENSTEEDIALEVSMKFLEWFPYYDPATGEIVMPSGSAGNQQNGEPTQSDQQADSSGNKTDETDANDVPSIGSDGDKPGKAVAEQVGQTKTSSLTNKAGTPETDEKQPKENDTVKEKADIKGLDEIEADPEEEAANNDITTGGKPKLPDVKLGNTPETPVKDIYQHLEEISNTLIGIIKEKPVQHQLSQKVGDVIQALMKLLSSTQNMNGGSLSQMTLAGGA